MYREEDNQGTVHKQPTIYTQPYDHDENTMRDRREE